MQENIYREPKQKELVITADKYTPEQLSYRLELVAAYRDKKAFTELFQFFAPKVKHFGFARLGSEASANELVQETMASVWKKAHLYHPEKGAATTWVYTTMRNACFDMLRKIKSKSEQNLADDIWPLDQAQLESGNEESEFKDHLMSAQVMRYVDLLPPAQQTIIKGVYYQELSQEQLAQQLGVPLGTIKSRLRLALAKLKQQMGERL